MSLDRQGDDEGIVANIQASHEAIKSAVAIGTIENVPTAQLRYRVDRPEAVGEGFANLRRTLPYLFATCPKLGDVVVEDPARHETWTAGPAVLKREANPYLSVRQVKALASNATDWGFIGKKQRHLRPADDESRMGDVWTFCAIDADTKIVPCFRVGKRDRSTANAFVADLAGRLNNRVQISTDGLSAYVDAIERGFGVEVNYGQIVKTYAAVESVTPERRYSAPEVIAVRKTAVTGDPDHSLISTSYIER